MRRCCNHFQFFIVHEKGLSFDMSQVKEESTEDVSSSLQSGTHLDLSIPFRPKSSLKSTSSFKSVSTSSPRGILRNLSFKKKVVVAHPETLYYLPISWKQLKSPWLLPVQQLLLVGKDACPFHLDTPQSYLLCQLNRLMWVICHLTVTICPNVVFAKRSFCSCQHISRKKEKKKIVFCYRKILAIHQFQDPCPCLEET